VLELASPSRVLCKRASRIDVPAEDAREIVRSYQMWNPEQPGLAALEAAGQWCDRAQLNFWDAPIVASAKQAGCRWLLSEDYQASCKFGGVTVVNPFEQRPAEFDVGR
jgi:predicted nucleic acid-binding protein